MCCGGNRNRTTRGTTTMITFPQSGSPNQKFTSKERDTESGLDYFGARYFSGAQGRFTSPDLPFADQHPQDPQSWNLYTYVRNNPLIMIDPKGRDALWIVDKKTGETKLVIPVNITGSSATKENGNRSGGHQAARALSAARVIGSREGEAAPWR